MKTLNFLKLFLLLSAGIVAGCSNEDEVHFSTCYTTYGEERCYELVDTLGYVRFTEQATVEAKERFLQEHYSSLSFVLDDRSGSYSFVKIKNVAELSALEKREEIAEAFPVYLSDKKSILALYGMLFVNTDKSLKKIEDLLNRFGIKYRDIRTEQSSDGKDHYFHRILISNPDCIGICNLLAKQPGVNYAEPDFTYFIEKCSTSFQWPLENTEGNGIFAKDAWTISKGVSNIKIAVLDDGVELAHPDLKANLLPGFNAVTDIAKGENGAPKYGDAHGTNCSGIIAAVDNNQGITGVAPHCKIIPIRIYYNKFTNVSSSTVVRDEWIVEGLKYAERMGADIINCSWGDNESHKSELTDKINELATQGRGGRGCIIVASSGNFNSTTINYPASLPNVIAVGASKSNGARWEDSNYGNDLDLVAPGTQIYTTTKDDYYEHVTGTSFSAPHVAGVAALMLSVNPSLTRTQLKEILCKTCQKTSRHTFSTNATYGRWSDQVGYGIVDAYDALRMIQFQKSTLVQEDAFTYTINNLPRKAKVVWSSSSSDFTLANPVDSVAKILTRDCGKSTTLTAKVYYDNALIKQFTKNISSVLTIEGSNHISCCGQKAKRIGYLPYGATLSWNVSDNVDIDSQKGDSIRVSMVEGTSSGYWIEAVVRANGKTYTKRENLVLRKKEGVDMDFLSDTRGPGGSKRFAIYADPIDNNGRSMRDIPEETIVRWWCRRSPNSGTDADATLDSEDQITSSMLVKPAITRASTLPDTVQFHPITFSSYPPIDPFLPVTPPIIPLVPNIDATDINFPHRLKVTLPDQDYEGIVTCWVYSHCAKATLLSYLVNKDGISVYTEKTSPTIYSAPTYRVTSSSPAGDHIAVRRMETEENDTSLHEVKLLLYNDFGLVRTVNGTSEEELLQMNVADLPNGTYYLNVHTGNSVIKQVIRIKH